MTRPILPLDPMGRSTDTTKVAPPGGVGPVGQREPMPETAVEVHSYPRSDIMNTPGIVMEMGFPSTSATMMVNPWWRLDRNVLGDADGLPTPYAKRFDLNMAVANPAVYSGNWQREPNVDSRSPQGVQMSGLMARFNAYLSAVQQHLLGAP